MIWVFVFLLAIIVLGVLVEPFFRSQREDPSLDDQDYLAAQIQDIARDKAAGLISEEDAAAADLEARRRLLAASRTGGDDVAAKNLPRAGAASRQASTMIIAAAPLAAIVLYVIIGNPALNLTPEAARDAARKMPPGLSTATSPNAPPVGASIAALEERLEANPQDLDGWVALAESYARQGRFVEAATAFGSARALSPERAFLHAAEGEAIAMSGGGVVTPDAQAAFDRALAIDAKEPRARFYSAIGADQRGAREEALAAMVALANDAPAGANWLPVVRSQIELIAEEIGRPMDELGLVSAGDRVTVLEAEVAGGEAAYESWISLVDAYASAGNIEKATTTLERARERFANAPFVLSQLDGVAARLVAQGDVVAAGARRGPTPDQMAAAASMSEDDRKAMIQGMVGGLAVRLEDDPDDLEGWTMLARSYAVLEQHVDSAAAYARAIALAPSDISLRIGRAEALLNDLNTRDQDIDEETKKAISQVASLDAEHPFALYFLGVAAQQSGDAASAKSYWARLVAVMPDGTPDAARIQSMIDAL